MLLTLKALKRLGACEVERSRFKTLFGDEVEVTRDLCVAHASDFSWEWAAEHLLSPEGYAAYEKQRGALYAAYQKKCAPFYAAYQKKCGAFYAAYQKKRAPFYAAYQKKCGAFYAAYEKKRGALYAAYQKKRAGIFYDLFEGEQGNG